MRHLRVMLKSSLSATIRGIEAERRCEDWASTLSCLHGSGGVASAGADTLNVVDNGDLRVTSKDKIAVHAVYKEFVRHSALCSREALRYHGSPVDSARAGRMP